MRRQRFPTQLAPDHDVLQSHPAASSTALILNPKASCARRASGSAAIEAERLVGAEHCYWCGTPHELSEAISAILDKGYSVLACGGGDGTVARVLNQLVAEAKRRGLPQGSWPAIAVLPMGTGNAVWHAVGRGRGLDPLRRLVGLGEAFATKDMYPIEAKTDIGAITCFLVGAGFDAQWLNDYVRLKDSAKSSLLRRVMSSAALGYLAAFLGRTLPRLQHKGPRFHVRVRAVRGEAYYVDPRRGDVVEARPQGSVLFEGACWLVSAGTVPFYGAGLKMFPFAGLRPGFMQIRIARITPLRGLINAVPIWRGSFRDEQGCLDFLAQEVEIELEQPAPMQHSGEAMGLHRRLRLKVADSPLRVVDCM